MLQITVFLDTSNDLVNPVWSHGELNSFLEMSLGLGAAWWGMQASKQSRNNGMDVTMATRTQPTTQAAVTLRSSVENVKTYNPHTNGQQGGREGLGEKNPVSHQAM